MDSTASYPTIARLRRSVPPPALADLIGPPVAALKGLPAAVLIWPPAAALFGPPHVVLFGPPHVVLFGPPVVVLPDPPAAGHRLLRRPRDDCHSLAAWSRRSRVASSPGPRADRWSARVAGRRTGGGVSSTGRRIRGIFPDV